MKCFTKEGFVVFLGIAMVLSFAGMSQAAPVGTAFTYQGRLTDDGGPATGNYDFKFSLFDDAVGGNLLGSTNTKLNEPVHDGYFTVVLDFGKYFVGEARWLEIAVRPTGLGLYQTLGPRQELTPTPYAIYSMIAGSVVGGIGIDGSGTANYLAKFQDSGTLTESILYESSGNIGIGTTTPSYPLHIRSSEIGGIRFDGTATGAWAGISINAEGVNSFPALDYYKQNSLKASAFVNGSDNWILRMNLNDVLTATPLGNVGIGTAIPDGKLVAQTSETSAGTFAVKGIGPLDTWGYLGVQGAEDFGGVTNADWTGKEIGVAGISIGSSSSDNWGVIGHSNTVGVRGEYSGNPTEDYGELGKNGIGVYGSGSTRAGYFDGSVFVQDNDLSQWDVEVQRNNMKQVLLGSGTLGGVVAVLDDSENTVVQLFPSSSGEGGGLGIFRNDDPLYGFFVDGNYSGTEATRVTIAGPSRATYFRMDQSGNSSVVLPNQAISDTEILDEPGIANNASNDTSFALGSIAGLYAFTSRSISIPAGGYVLAIGTLNVQLSHYNGTTTWGQFGLSDDNTIAALPAYQDMDLYIHSSSPSGIYYQSVAVQGLFSESSAGTYTYYFMGEEVSGNVDVADVHFTLIYLPTAYGTVDTMAAAGTAQIEVERNEDGVLQPLTAVEIEAERQDSQAFNAARMQAELDAMRAELDAIKEEMRLQN
jgi:hypothetical protein